MPQPAARRHLATSFHPVTCFGRTAELVAEHTDKSHLVAIEGRLSTGNYTNDAGETVYTLEVIANRQAAPVVQIRRPAVLQTTAGRHGQPR